VEKKTQRDVKRRRHSTAPRCGGGY
jgi:hypothetical protein